MRLRRDKRAPLFLAFIFFLASSGCIVPNRELVQLRDEVNELKKENAGLLRSDENLSAKLLRLGKELASIKSDFKKELDSARKGLSRAGADTGARLDSIQAEFQRLTGRFEEVKHFSEKTSLGNEAFIESAESRMSAIEDKINDLGKRITDIADELAAIKLAVTQPAGEKEPDEAKVPPNELYKAGLNAVREGKTEEAREKFKQYLRDYPDGPLANNAQFWTGESYYNEKNYERAIIEYDDVIKKYPQGIKVPAAMLKQAMAFERIKDSKTAQALFKKLVKKYPDSEEARIAKKKIKKRKKK